MRMSKAQKADYIVNAQQKQLVDSSEREKRVLIKIRILLSPPN